MALVLFTKGAQLIMSRALNKSAPGDLRLKLFKSNTTLTTATAIGDLTLAASCTASAADWTPKTEPPGLSTSSTIARTSGAAETRYDSPARRRRRREQQLLFEFGAAQEIP